MPDPIMFGIILGGVNYTFPPNALPQHFLADSRNILPVLSGYASPRKGSLQLNEHTYGASLITSFNELIVSGTSNKFAATGTVVGKLGASDFSDHITGLTTGTYGQWINYGGYAIYANGSNNVQKTDGTTASDLTAHLSGLTGGACLAEWGERVWVSVAGTLYGSALRALTDFNTTTTDIGYWEGTIGSSNDSITGLSPFFDILVIGKMNQLYQLSGAPETASSTFRLTPLFAKGNKDSVGFTAKNGITQVGNDLLFLDGFTIKALSGIQAYGDVESISIVGNIRDFLIDSSGAGLDSAYLSRSHFFHYKHREQVYVSIPTGESTRYWFVIDYSNQDIRKSLGLPKYSFFPMYGLTPICFGGVENGSKIDIYAGCHDGFVRHLDTGQTDDGVAIDSHATWCVGHPIKDIQPVALSMSLRHESGCTLTPSYAFGLQEWQKIIDSTSFTALNTESVSGDTWIKNGNVYAKVFSSFMVNSGQSFAFKIRHNKVGETFELRDMSLRYRLQKRYLV